MSSPIRGTPHNRCIHWWWRGRAQPVPWAERTSTVSKKWRGSCPTENLLDISRMLSLRLPLYQTIKSSLSSNQSIQSISLILLPPAFKFSPPKTRYQHPAAGQSRTIDHGQRKMYVDVACHSDPKNSGGSQRFQPI